MIQEIRPPGLRATPPRSIVDASMEDLFGNCRDFTSMYTRYFPRVMEYIRIQHKKLHPEAEDIAQDIFLIIWRRRDRLLQIGPLDNYFFVMVKNRLLNDQKKSICRQQFRRQLPADPSHAYAPQQEL